METKRLFLVDGNSLLYRSYYAIRHLTTSAGFPTNAIYGFVTTLRKLIDREKPDYLGVVFDVKGPTVRHEAFKDYKAHRKPMPDDLVVQVPVLKEVLRALRIPTAEYEGYEADDVLATLARKAEARDLRAVIVTTDKDLLQVVDAATVVYNPAKETTLDEAGVREVFGVAADRVTGRPRPLGRPDGQRPGRPRHRGEDGQGPDPGVRLPRRAPGPPGQGPQPADPGADRPEPRPPRPQPAPGHRPPGPRRRARPRRLRPQAPRREGGPAALPERSSSRPSPGSS